MHAVAQQSLRFQFVLGQIRLPQRALVAQFRAILLRERREEVVIHERVPMLARRRQFRRIGFLGQVRWLRYVIVLHQNLRRGALPRAADDVLIFVVRAIDVKDEQVRLERIQVRLRRLHEQLRREPAERAILDDEIRVREPPPQILLHHLGPLLFGDGLAVEKNPHRVALLRRARGEQAHRALDVAAPAARVGKLHGRISVRLRGAREKRRQRHDHQEQECFQKKML